MKTTSKNRDHINKQVKERRDKNRLVGMKLLKIIQYGDIHTQLTCCLTNKIVESCIDPYDLSPVTLFDLHHIVCVNNKSHYKENEPSEILRSPIKKDKKLLELMSCIPISTGEHAKFHKRPNCANTDLTWWINIWSNNIGYMPYVFRGEYQYDDVCILLKKITDIDVNISYNNFISSLTT